MKSALNAYGILKPMTGAMISVLRPRLNQQSILRDRSSGHMVAGGFTVVETIIVLAVSAALFIAATILVAGQQNQVAFQQGIQEMQSVIQETINQVSAGFYTNRGNFKCTIAGAGITITPGAAQQGSNTGCTFMGKAMEFGVQGSSPQQYIIYPLATRAELIY